MQRIIHCFLMLLLIPFSSYSQTYSLDQSSSFIEWKKIESKHVNIIYPSYHTNESIYAANLVEYYSNMVGLSYNILSPESFTLVIRPELSSPNGFVTVAPRRSEWFSSFNFSSAITTLDWQQTLAIHEYRHVVQFDYYKKGFVKFLYYAFGDTGLALGIGISLQPWFFEGDAVWAETKFSDGGRGRSALFSSRLKAILSSGQIPTYDEFVNGSYNTYLPNHYVFGYILVSSAIKRFGNDFWSKVLTDMATLPHPFRINFAFEKNSGMDFFDFYNLTMKELKEEWAVIGGNKNIKTDLTLRNYVEEIYPYISSNNESVFYLFHDLDSQWQLMEKSKNENKIIKEINFEDSLSTFNIRNNKAIYSQFLPDSRYQYVSYSDLFVINLENGAQKRITSNKRMYNPRLNYDATKFLALEFTEKNKWQLAEYSIDGKKIKNINVSKGLYVAEAEYVDDQKIAAIIANNQGLKGVVEINLENGKVLENLAFSRNYIYNLSSDSKGNVLFESQYKGAVNIFKLDRYQKLSQCTFSAIRARSASSNGETLFYSEETVDGFKLSESSLSKCRSIDKKLLGDYNYLAGNSSDNYNNFSIVSFNNQSKMHSNELHNHVEKDYGQLDKRLFKPHSWSFVAGNGFGLMLQTDNYLRTLSTTLTVGSAGGENVNYYELDLTWKKYLIQMNLNAAVRNRAIDQYRISEDVKWRENVVGIEFLLPIIAKSNLYNISTMMTFGSKKIWTSKYGGALDRENFVDDSVFSNEVALSHAVTKDLTYRGIYPKLGYSLSGSYRAADSGKTKFDPGYQIFYNAEVYVPSFFKHDGFRVSYSSEKQAKSLNAYKYVPNDISIEGATFSRGFGYFNTPYYKKLSTNYHFPIGNPDLKMTGMLYLKRMYGNLFYDQTKVDTRIGRINFDSFGFELINEIRLMRILPLNLGFRYLKKDGYVGYESEIFLESLLSF